MDNYQIQTNQHSPCFPINSDTFTFNSSKVKSIQMKRQVTPYLSSPMSLLKLSPSDQIKETETSNSQLSYLISPRDTALSFKDPKANAVPIQYRNSSQSLKDFRLSASSETGSSSRNQKSPDPQIDSKDKQLVLPNTKFSSKYQGDSTIIEDPQEESFQLKKRRTNPLFLMPKRDYSENESTRMIVELLKLSTLQNRLAQKYHIDVSNAKLKRQSSSSMLKEEKQECSKVNSDNTCSTEDNEEELDEETKLFCFLSIPKVVYKNDKKVLMCVSPSQEGIHKEKHEEYHLTFKNYASMKANEIISFKSITLCQRQLGQTFIIQLIQAKTFLKKTYTITTSSIDECLKYTAGINLLLKRTSLHYYK